MKLISTTLITTAMALASFSAQAAIALDRTRVIFDGNQKSVSLNIKNNNKEVPYLAQAWIEDVNGNKIVKPFIILPPIQRLEPSGQSQLKVQTMADVAKLPTDRETLFYFNLREIPPRSEKANILQLALQTRIKMFYRPAAIYNESQSGERPWQEMLTLVKKGANYVLVNPTPYYITLVDAHKTDGGPSIAGYEPIMIAPKEEVPFKLSPADLGNTPILTYVGDYGGHRQIHFQCDASQCVVVPK